MTPNIHSIQIQNILYNLYKTTTYYIEFTYKYKKLFTTHTNYTQSWDAYTKVGTRIHKVGTRIAHNIQHSVVGTRICTRNSGRVVWDAQLHTLQVGTPNCTLINSSFGTRIGTSIWDANSGRQVGTRICTSIRDAYLHTKVGTRNLGRVSHTKLHRIHKN